MGATLLPVKISEDVWAFCQDEPGACRAGATATGNLYNERFLIF